MIEEIRARDLRATYRGVGILYEDNHLLVIVKPPNMPVQADASGDMDALSVMKRYIAEKYHKPGEAYLGLVHRLDRPVGGVLVLARTSKAAARLSGQIRAGGVGRRYWAVVQGEAPAEGLLEDWLLKDENHNTARVVPEGTAGAKWASLSYRRVAGGEGLEPAAGHSPAREAGRWAGECPLSLLEVTLHTGRSHQIRVQLAHAGFPLWGDARYGGGQPGQQIALWAAELSFKHPTRDAQITARSRPPAAAAPWSRILGAPAAE